MFYITSVEAFCKSNAIDDAKRNAGLKTPDTIDRIDDIRYGADERNVLDVYRPKDRKGKLPVIVSVHGGGWVYGNKEIMQFYCMSLAEKGFAVINFSYRLAPKHKHPTPLTDMDNVVYWMLQNAEKYGLDVNNVFGVGDSVGANILGFYACACTDADCAKKLCVNPPKCFAFNAIALNCGLYRLIRGEELLLDSFMTEYMQGGGTDEEYGEIDLAKHLNPSFPPSFVMTANQDFLRRQAKPFHDCLKSLGVETKYRCYGDKDTVLTHVFHINIKLADARKCNGDECAFFKKHIKRTAGD